MLTRRRPSALRSAAAAVLAAVALAPSLATAQPVSIDGNRWSGSTATAQPQGFTQGSPLTLTWGFMATGTPINDSTFSGFANANNNLPAFLNGIYGSQATWQPIFQSVFNRWSSVSGLTYVYEPNDDGAAISGSGFPVGVTGVRADLRIGGKTLDGNSNVLAYNYFPNVGDMVIDTADNFYSDTSSSSIRLRNVTSHEHGHGLGMEHVDSNNASFLMEPFYSAAFDGPQHHDILMAHRAYGDANEKSNAGLGNDVFNRATPLGNIPTSGNVSRGNSARALAVAAAATDFISIDDNTDTDFFSFSVASAGTISLLAEPLGFTYNVTAQNAGGNVAFNTLLRSDLTLTLISTNGTTVLATANSGGLGANESLNFALAAAGTYYARITGVDNVDAIDVDTQFYAITAGFTAIPEPASLLALGALGAAMLRRR